MDWLSDASRAAWQRLGGAQVIIAASGESARHGGMLTVTEADGLFTGWMRQNAVAAVIVRPDRYVYGAAGNAGRVEHADRAFAAEPGRRAAGFSSRSFVCTTGPGKRRRKIMNNNENCRIRLHHRRRRLGRLRAGQPPDRPTASIRCCCWKPGPRTATSGSTCRSATASCSRKRPSTGCTRPSRSPGSNGRQVFQPRGKVLGGSSSINGLLYVRGQHEDYDRWRQRGNVGWGYDDVLPYFKKAENQQRGADEYHGTGGPLPVSDWRHDDPLSEAFVKAAVEAGIPFNPDFNGATQEGAGFFQTTTRRGRRASQRVLLSAAGEEPRQSADRDRRAGAAPAVRGQARARRRIQAARRVAHARGRARKSWCRAAPTIRRNCCSSPASARPSC